ncbi:MAG TPA: hypothetical protein VFC15_19835 [Candidatus Limnocylindrales bacterium]|jgi:hypothetical protein|nr:hypothetical protein [Candidatus Limnocylindrales bacterium]
MPTRNAGQQRRPKQAGDYVFLNLPYDAKFEPLYLAYIAGVSAFGLLPRTPLEIPGGSRRLDNIFDQLRGCRYSIHDLSRVQVTRTAPRTPRFNMPFELGLAVAHQKAGGDHTWFVFEQLAHRLSKSLSDLDGSEVYLHDGKPNGILAALSNAFIRSDRQPTVDQMLAIYRELRSAKSTILHDAGAKTLFAARPFKDLSTLASALADGVILGSSR